MIPKLNSRSVRFMCPRCNQLVRTNVMDTREGRRKQSVYIKRRRVCDLCGYRFTTVEIMNDKYTQLQKLDLIELQVIVNDMVKTLNDYSAELRKLKEVVR